MTVHLKGQCYKDTTSSPGRFFLALEVGRENLPGDEVDKDSAVFRSVLCYFNPFTKCSFRVMKISNKSHQGAQTIKVYILIILILLQA